MFIDSVTPDEVKAHAENIKSCTVEKTNDPSVITRRFKSSCSRLMEYIVSLVSGSR